MQIRNSTHANYKEEPAAGQWSADGRACERIGGQTGGRTKGRRTIGAWLSPLPSCRDAEVKFMLAASAPSFPPSLWLARAQPPLELAPLLGAAKPEQSESSSELEHAEE